MNRAVIITGARAPVAIDVARSFVAAGYDVHLADSMRAWAATLSRAHTGAIHRLPPPRTAFPAFAQALTKLVDQLNPIAIIPTCEDVFYVAAAGAAYGFSNIVLAPPLATLRTLHSKLLFVDHAKSHGIKTPQTWAISSADDLVNVPLDPDDLVLKPEYSRFGTQTLIRPNLAQRARVDFTTNRQWAAQRYIHGDEICLWSFARAGKIVAAAAYRPIWRHRRTAAYAFMPITCPPALEIARIIAAATGITGHLSFDIILTPDGQAIPIECNPRATSGVHLFDANPQLAQAMLGKGDAIPVQDPRYLGPAMALLGLPSACVSGRVRAWATMIMRGQDVVGRTGDRLPIIGTVMDAARFAAQAIINQQSAASATTNDIEWNGDPI